MSQHRSLKGASTIAAKRNVLKRFERVELLRKRGQFKDGDKVKVVFVFAEREPVDGSFLLRDVIPVAPASKMDEIDHSKMDHGTMNHGDKKP